MPKLNYLQTDVKLIKRKGNNFKKFKLYSFLVLCLAFVVLLASVFSSALTVGNFQFSSLFGSGNVKVKSHSLYSVNMDSFNNFDQAQQMSELVAMQGASAFVWQKGNTFLVVGNVYKTKADADKVKTNLLTTNPNVSIWQMEFKQVNLKFDNYTKEQKDVVQKALNNVTYITDKMYDYVIALETKELMPTTVSSHVNLLKSDCIIIGSNLDVLNSTTIYEPTIKLKNSYVKITETLNELVLKLISVNDVSHISKFSYVQLLKIKYDLFNNL